MSAIENKLIKTLMDSGTLVAISALISFLSKKMFKKYLTSDPSSSLMNFGEWTLVLASALYIQDYLEKNKIIPS